jgi:hypothetical protein
MLHSQTENDENNTKGDASACRGSLCGRKGYVDRIDLTAAGFQSVSWKRAYAGVH